MLRAILVEIQSDYPEGGFPYATDYFSKESVDSEDIMQHWPANLEEVPSVNIDTDKFGGGAKAKRFTPQIPGNKASSTEITVARQTTDVAVYSEKRFVKALFTATKNFFARAGTWLGREANRLQSLKDQGGLRIAEKGKGAKYTDQEKAAKEIAGVKNWQKCINGEKPEKNGPAKA
ncbi:hypothetical protein NX059_008218 [Plenodomus lindquistii]|nr:hypothetical protein NX059_008218 [Plenodomus lindquistii]